MMWRVKVLKMSLFLVRLYKWGYNFSAKWIGLDLHLICNCWYEMEWNMLQLCFLACVILLPS